LHIADWRRITSVECLLFASSDLTCAYFVVPEEADMNSECFGPYCFQVIAKIDVGYLSASEYVTEFQQAKWPNMTLKVLDKAYV
jgi:hypothetical protein